MNDLLKLTNEMVSNINNTSNLTNTQLNSTWKSPTQTQENKIEQIHQRFLKAQEWGNNLKQENSTTEITTSSNKPKKRVKRRCPGGCDSWRQQGEQLSRQWSREWAEKENLKETNHINSLDPRISFLGSDMQQRGVLWLDTLAKRIKFYPKTYYDGSNGYNSNEQTFGIETRIVVKNKDGQVIRDIVLQSDMTMTSVLNNHNLNSKNVPNDGLDYEDGYTLEITSSQADTTKFKRDECCDWYWNTSNGQHTETLTIINDWLWHKDYYQEKYFSLLVDWTNKVKHGRTDSYEWILEHLHDYKQNIQIIKNQIAIDNLKTEISKIYNKISELETQIRNLKNKSINGLSACSSTAGAINSINGALKVASTAFSFIPVFGQGISSVISLASSACSLANSYGRKRRDVSIIENKFDDNFIKSINQEQHLPSMTNHTNDLVKNITTSL